MRKNEFTVRKERDGDWGMTPVKGVTTIHELTWQATQWHIRI